MSWRAVSLLGLVLALSAAPLLDVTLVDNFSDDLMFGSWLVRFCEPDHPRCINDGIMEEIRAKKQLVHLAHVDCHTNEDDCLDARISEDKYPTYRLYIELDKSRNIFPLAQYPTETDKQKANALWDWVDKKVNQNIVIINDENFKELIPHTEWVISFINNWDMHSKIFKSKWRSISLSLISSFPSLQTGEVVCSNSPRTCKSAEITVTPTLVYSYKGEIHYFNGDRNIDVFMETYSEEKIMQWIHDIKSNKHVREEL